MERYADVLLYAIPVFLLLLTTEWLVARIKKAEVIEGMDTLSGISSGITNIIKDVLGLSFVIISYGWLVDKISLLEISEGWWLYALAFIGLDFAGYWNHRLAHKVNYFWNVHLVHHSSEEFNLSCALRQSISSFFGTLVVFLVPTAILGIPAEVVTVVAPLHLFAQYWYHTRLINKMGFLEKILVTPSHHRVHHAINKEYLDKNLSQIFIIWDKLFGTFQEELPEVPPVYGVKKAPRTRNPVLINFQHLSLLIKDAWRTSSVKDKLRIWFMPTGWRPADMKESYPVEIIEDVYSYEKYRPELSSAMKSWCWLQGFVTFLMLLHYFATFRQIGSPGIFIYGAFLYLQIFTYTAFMDKAAYAAISSFAHTLFGFSIIFYTGDWFGISSITSPAIYAVSFYLVLAFIINSSVLLFREKKSILFLKYQALFKRVKEH